MEDIEQRVFAFTCLEVPGQPLCMHQPETLRLVNDLWAEIEKLNHVVYAAVKTLNDNIHTFDEDVCMLNYLREAVAEIDPNRGKKKR